MQARVQAVWNRIERWFEANLGGTKVSNLAGPATRNDLSLASEKLGRDLPLDAQEIYLVHSGDGDPPGLFGAWDRFLGVAEAIKTWEIQQAVRQAYPPIQESESQWRTEILSGQLHVRGPVKAYLGSALWFPITDMNGDVYRFLDFDPAAGGRPGQVICVDLECRTYDVIAQSFIDLLESYAADLEAGRIVFSNGDLEAVAGDDTDDPAEWGLPDYLRV